MKRRSFLGLLAAAVAVPAVKAEPLARTDELCPSTAWDDQLSYLLSTGPRIPFAPYEPDMARFAVIDEDGRLGYVLQGPTA